MKYLKQWLRGIPLNPNNCHCPMKQHNDKLLTHKTADRRKKV